MLGPDPMPVNDRMGKMEGMGGRYRGAIHHRNDAFGILVMESPSA